MGDRAQVQIVDDVDPKRSVFLYTHWGGDTLIDDVHTALAKRWRWEDCSYLARCVFTVMQGEDRLGTGYGIDTAEHGDLENPLIVLQPSDQSIDIGEWHASFEDFTTDPTQGRQAYGAGSA